MDKFPLLTFLTPWYAHVRVCNRGLRDVRFSENFACALNEWSVMIYMIWVVYLSLWSPLKKWNTVLTELSFSFFFFKYVKMVYLFISTAAYLSTIFLPLFAINPLPLMEIKIYSKLNNGMIWWELIHLIYFYKLYFLTKNSFLLSKYWTIFLLYQYCFNNLYNP